MCSLAFKKERKKGKNLKSKLSAVIFTVVFLIATTTFVSAVSAPSATSEPKRQFVVIEVYEDLPYPLIIVQPTMPNYTYTESIEVLCIMGNETYHGVTWTELGRVCAEMIEIIPTAQIELVYP